MRPIIFRGKRVDNGEWVYGFYVKAEYHWHEHGRHKDWLICSACANGGWFVIHGRYPVDAETVGQYTGLTDKNGKKIFEGDILQGTITSRWNKAVIRCEVVYSKDGFISLEKTRNSDWEHKVRFSKDIEVIGNIHDNPELLKELQNEENR